MVWHPDDTPVGTTLTLRIRTPVGPIHVVGELLEPLDGRQRLRRRDGEITEFEPADVEAARVVPPPKSAQISAEDLDRIGSLGWRAAETEPLGEWLLRAADGFTQRANSCLAVGDPGMSIDAAVDALEAWYAARSLAVRAHALTDGVIDRELIARGFAPTMAVNVMTAEIGHLLRAAKPIDTGLELRIDDAPGDAWISIWRATTDPLPPTSKATAVRHHNVAFVSLNDEGKPVAVARVAVDGRWGGLFAIAVDPAYQERGLGRAITVAAIRESGRRGARHSYLQVLEDNLVAQGLYESLGFSRHHSYRYLHR